MAFDKSEIRLSYLEDANCIAPHETSGWHCKNCGELNGFDVTWWEKCSFCGEDVQQTQMEVEE